MKKYYIEVKDGRILRDPITLKKISYIWQSSDYEDKREALKAARRLAQGFYRSDISPLLTSGELNPNWERSAKGVKKYLHVNLMCRDEENFDLHIEENVK